MAGRRPVRHAIEAAFVLLLLGTAIAARHREDVPGDLVELDIVAIDHAGHPVPDLQPQDFRIREEGHPIDIKTFTEVAADASTPDRGRSLVLLLDDSGVSIGGTSVVQAMASRILARMRPTDDVTVVRLNNTRDEAFGDRETAMQRIADYRGGAVPFQTPGTADRLLHVLTSVSGQLEAVEHRRKLVVCIGSPGVCNLTEPQPRGYNQLWKPWVSALAATARANVGVYAAMPIRPGGVMILGSGIADLTGGTGFTNTESFDAFVDVLSTEASHYYLAGYWPPSSDHDLRSIDVKAMRKGIAVRARRQR